MKRFLAPTIIGLASLGLAACGSGGYGSGSPSAPAAGGQSSAAVKVLDVPGVGSVLADAKGDVLYAADQEAADPGVLCADGCTAFWSPLTGSASQSGQLASDLGVAARPDGSTQVTYNGHRLYTFAQDSPGKAGGEGLSDMFGGQHFTWHAVVVGGGTATNSTPPQTGGAAAYPGY